jgi:hypothetical protein
MQDAEGRRQPPLEHAQRNPGRHARSSAIVCDRGEQDGEDRWDVHHGGRCGRTGRGPQRA